MRIAILSLNPRHNYGGILQSYALKKVLEGMGHDVRVICKKRHVPEFGIQQIIRWPYRLLRKLMGRKDSRVFTEHYYNKQNDKKYQNTDKFVDKYLNPRFVRSLKEIKESEFDAFVVGSDQVWRPKYFKGKFSSEIKDAFLDFAKGWNIKRIAYAASFGEDVWEYTDEETEKCAQLIKQFDAISVRENSGVKLCEEHFGIDIIQLCDPTLLIDKGDYYSLIPKTLPRSPGDLLVYCLDKNDELEKLVEWLSEEKGLTPYYFEPRSQEVLTPIEMWIQSFKDAKLIVTDSFHGCVFSLIFNKPVYIFNNKNRGESRIESLIEIFNNNGQIWSKTAGYYEPCCSLKNISDIIEQIRTKAINFLKDTVH